MALHRAALGFVHRQLWQRIPREGRRRALIRLSAAFAPQIAADPQGGPPYVVAGFLTAASGLGASARLCYRALETAGVPVAGIDLTRAMGQDGSRVEFPFADGRNMLGSGTLLVHVNAPFIPLALWRLGRARITGKLVIGCWHWELPEAPREWAIGTRFVHRIVAASRFSGAAMQRLGGRVPVSVVGLPVEAPPADLVDTVDRTPNQPMRVLVVFNMASGYTRKNPLGALRAFLKAFPEPGRAQLVVKAVNLDVHPAGAAELRAAISGAPHIALDERVLTATELWQLYASTDVVLSLHRSEGFGLVVAEAMRAGRAVVATDWSGTRDFLDWDCGVPVPCRLVPARDPQGEYDHPGLLWAEPDETAAAAHLMHLAADAECRRNLGARARHVAGERFSLSCYAEAIIRVAARGSD